MKKKYVNPELKCCRIEVARCLIGESVQIVIDDTEYADDSDYL